MRHQLLEFRDIGNCYIGAYIANHRFSDEVECADVVLVSGVLVDGMPFEDFHTSNPFHFLNLQA